MAARSHGGLQQHLRQIQLITANSSEGVIMIDVNQEIRWANAAALAMHAVHAHTDLGRTIDEYHANFQVKVPRLASRCLGTIDRKRRRRRVPFVMS